MNKQDNIAGNYYNKYASQNIIVRRLMKGFLESLTELVEKTKSSRLVEIGCGEGYLARHFSNRGMKEILAGDVDPAVVDFARQQSHGLDIVFQPIDIYKAPEQIPNNAQLVICCEVLEHLHDPASALEALQKAAPQNLILSVPREPLWRLMNLARLKYITALGNTPGHFQHWSKTGFIELVSRYFDVREVKAPVPWVMLSCQPKRDRP